MHESARDQTARQVYQQENDNLSGVIVSEQQLSFFYTLDKFRVLTV